MTHFGGLSVVQSSATHSGPPNATRAIVTFEFAVRAWWIRCASAFGRLLNTLAQHSLGRLLNTSAQHSCATLTWSVAQHFCTTLLRNTHLFKNCSTLLRPKRGQWLEICDARFFKVFMACCLCNISTQ